MNPLDWPLKDAPGIILAIDGRGSVVYHNQGLTQLETRRPPNDGPMEPGVYYPDQESLIEACRLVMMNQRPLILEMGKNDSNGPSLWYQCEIRPLLNKRGLSDGAIATALDITPKKRAEERLKRGLSLLIDAQGIAHLGTWEWEIGHTTVSWSDELFRIYGETRQSYTPTYEGYLEKIHPEDRERVMAVMTQVFENQISFSHDERIRRPDGSIRYLHTWGHPIVNDNGELVRLIGVCLDITDRVEVENRLLESEKFKSAILETVMDALISIDHEGKILEFNLAAEGLFGLKRSEVLGRDLAKLMIPPRYRERHRKGLEHYLKTGQGPFLNKRIELPAWGPGGVEFDAEIAITAIPRAGPPRFTGILRDITEEKRRKEKLQQEVAQRIQAETSLRGQRKILEMLALGASLREVLEELIRVIEPQTNGMICSVLLLDPHGIFFIKGVAPGLPKSFNEAIERAPIGPRAGSCGTAAFSRKNVIVTDTYTDPLWENYRGLAMEHELRACWSVPIFSSNDKVLGTFALYSKDVRAPNNSDLELIQECRHIAGVAIEHVQTRESLEKTVSLLNATLESTADGILVVDLEGEITGLNDNFLDLWRIPSDLGKSRNHQKILNFLLGQVQDPAGFKARIKEFQDHPDWEVTDIIFLKDGRIFERYSRPQKLGDKIVGRVLSVRCITERQKAKESLEKYASHLKALADASLVFEGAHLNFDHTLDLVAKWIVRGLHGGCLIGLLSPDQNEMDMAAIHHEIPAIQAKLSEFFKGPPLSTGEGTLRKVIRTGYPLGLFQLPEGTPPDLDSEELLTFLQKFQVNCLLVVPLRSAGRIMGIAMVFGEASECPYTSEDLGFLQNLADRAGPILENAKLYAEAQQAITLREDFLALASHELKTPLSPLMTQLQTLQKILRYQVPGQAPWARDLGELVASSEQQVFHLAHLADDLLEVSRAGLGPMALNRQKVDLLEVVQEVVEQLKGDWVAARSEVHLLGDSQTSTMGHWDRLKIKKVIFNLLSNSIKFGAGGPIEITLGQKGNRAFLIFRDFGIGISQEDQLKIFHRFERAVSLKHYGGFGLGLYISREIVKAHGGLLGVESGPGEGAAFRVELPLTPSN